MFVCDLNGKEFIIMGEDLEGLLNLADDKVWIVDIGQTDISGDRISTISTPLNVQRETVTVM